METLYRITSSLTSERSLNYKGLRNDVMVRSMLIKVSAVTTIWDRQTSKLGCTIRSRPTVSNLFLLLWLPCIIRSCNERKLTLFHVTVYFTAVLSMINYFLVIKTCLLRHTRCQHEAGLIGMLFVCLPSGVP